MNSVNFHKFYYMISHSLSSIVLLTVFLGLIYPAAVTGVASFLFPYQAEGSLVKDDTGKIIGSALIGQDFTQKCAKPFTLFMNRPSSGGYNATSSGGYNYGPNNEKLSAMIAERADFFNKARTEAGADLIPVPYDLLTASSSGLDPHISLEAALYQVPMVAAANGLNADELVKFVVAEAETELFSSVPRINVLLLNHKLIKTFKHTVAH